MANVAIVSTNKLTKAGVTSVILNLLTYMDTEKFKPVIITDKNVEESVELRLYELGVHAIRITADRNKKTTAYIKELTDILVEMKIDILHVHGNSATMWFEILAAKKAGGVVRIAHSHTSACLSRGVHYLLRPLLIHDMTFGIACSDLSQKFAFNNKKSMVLRNGINIERFQFDLEVRSAYRNDYKLKNKFVIGHVGNFLPVKNHEFICKIAKELKNRGVENFEFILLGEGTLRNSIELYIKENKLENDVVLLGSKNDVSAFYQAMDIFILPSIFEGFPMVLVEAQAAGLKCLISDNVTKTTNLIETAQYLPIGNENSVSIWADAIIEYMNSPQDILKRNDAKIMVEKAGFSAEQATKQLEKVYEKSLMGDI